jgi:hypothetical protein
MTAPAAGIVGPDNHLVGPQVSSRQRLAAEDHLLRSRAWSRNAVFLMAGFACHPCVGVMRHLLVVRRVALAAIHGGRRRFFMPFIGRLLVAFQTLNLAVGGIPMIIGHLFVAFRALVCGIPIPESVLRCQNKRAPDAEGEQRDQAHESQHMLILK